MRHVRVHKRCGATTDMWYFSAYMILGLNKDKRGRSSAMVCKYKKIEDGVRGKFGYDSVPGATPGG